MIFNAENILLIGSILLFVSIVVSKTGYRFGIPTLLVFLLVGMLFGSDGLGLQFHDAGEAQFIGMMALSIILFSGGLFFVQLLQHIQCLLGSVSKKTICFPLQTGQIIKFWWESLFLLSFYPCDQCFCPITKFS